MAQILEIDLCLVNLLFVKFVKTAKWNMYQSSLCADLFKHNGKCKTYLKSLNVSSISFLLVSG